MNTVMRTLGGALGGEIVATFLANNVAHGQPTVTGFTESFALEAAFLVVAVIAATLVPGSTRAQRALALEPELAPRPGSRLALRRLLHSAPRQRAGGQLGRRSRAWTRGPARRQLQVDRAVQLHARRPAGDA